MQFVPQDGREDFGANDEEEEDYDEEPAPRRGLDDEFDDEEDEDDEVDYDTFIIFICKGGVQIIKMEIFNGICH